jgi:hypothetical protein
MRVISLGWGRQSFTLAAMAAEGEISGIDAAIFADTNHEREATYEFAAYWTLWLRRRGLRVESVQAMDTTIINSGITIPAFTTDGKGSRGQLRRQCTDDWKIAPIRRWLQAERNKQPVELLIGISLDEYKRMKPSDVKYITHRWPLVDLRMSRADCERWLFTSGLPIPPRSSCVFCPYHDNPTWREMASQYPEDWEKANDVDRAIRKRDLPSISSCTRRGNL